MLSSARRRASISRVVQWHATLRRSPATSKRRARPKTRRSARSLKAHTSPSETVWNYGRDSQIYFYADRSPAVRFFYDRPYWLDAATLTETIASLRQARPQYIVDTQPGDAWDYHPPELMALLAQQYDYVGKVQYADLYRLKVLAVAMARFGQKREAPLLERLSLLTTLRRLDPVAPDPVLLVGCADVSPIRPAGPAFVDGDRATGVEHAATRRPKRAGHVAGAG